MPGHLCPGIFSLLFDFGGNVASPRPPLNSPPDCCSDTCLCLPARGKYIPVWDTHFSGGVASPRPPLNSPPDCCSGTRLCLPARGKYIPVWGTHFSGGVASPRPPLQPSTGRLQRYMFMSACPRKIHSCLGHALFRRRGFAKAAAKPSTGRFSLDTAACGSAWCANPVPA